jgi:acid phosphatase
MYKKITFSLLILILSSCVYSIPTSTPVVIVNTPVPTLTRSVETPTFTPTSTTVPATPTVTPTAEPEFVDFNLPNFNHIVLIVLENEYLQNILEDNSMPSLTRMASENVLLTNYSAITHPSLPNYLAMISGSTQNITTNCTDCFVDQANLADEIEASGRTWKAYFEDMPSPCFVGSKKPYVQYFNPFIYFNSIRLNLPRCTRSVVPLTQLDQDLASSQLTDFIYIAPNNCHSGHDCPPAQADAWLAEVVAKLQASPTLGQNSLIIITFDEGMQSTMPVLTRGEVATVLISPLARKGFLDDTPYTHYSLLKTILFAWDLPALGQTGQASTRLIVDIWDDQLRSIYPRALTPQP